MIIDSEEEEGVSSNPTAVVAGATKRKHSDAETGETSTKRPRTDQSAAATAATDNDDEDIIELD